MSDQQIQDMLNYLVNHSISCCIKAKDGIGSSGYASLFRYEPLLDSKDTNGYFYKIPERCYVFEIGKSCGTVFSTSLVKSIEFTGDHADITLK